MLQGMLRHCVILFAALLPATAPAAVLYKSVDANGTVTFSDLPPAPGARVLEARVIAPSGSLQVAPPAPAAAAEPLVLPLENDPMIAQANARLDQAERELALARRELLSPREGLRLAQNRMSAADDARVEFFKRNVAAARHSLMELLRDRRARMVAAASSRDGSPRYYVAGR